MKRVQRSESSAASRAKYILPNFLPSPERAEEYTDELFTNVIAILSTFLAWYFPISDVFGRFPDEFQCFRTIFGRFRTIFGDFRTFPDISRRFGLFPDHSKAFPNVFGAVKVPKNRTKVDEHFLFRRKMKCRGSSETRFAKV